MNRASQTSEPANAGARTIGPKAASVAVVGLGAIGSVVASALTGRADLCVTQRSSRTGFPRVIDGKGQTLSIDARRLTTPAEAHPVDWVLVSVKAQDTKATWPWLRQLVGPETRVAILQNGIDLVDRLPGGLAPERLLPVSVYLSATRNDAGDVLLQSRGSLVVPKGALGSAFAELFRDRIEVHESERFDVESWRKYMLNLVANSLGALTDRPTGAVLCTPLRPTAIAMLHEASAVGRATGVPLTDADIQVALDSIEHLPYDTITSMQADRRQGRPLERPYLSGALVSAAARAGVPVPVTKTIDTLLCALD